MTIVISCSVSEQSQVLEYISSHFFPSRVTLILYTLSNTEEFPINKLRNIAIKSVTTSHFLILDMDLWPTRGIELTTLYIVNVYDEIMKLPPSVYSSKNAAVILPTFFFDRQSFLNSCTSLSTCASLFSFILTIICRALQFFPSSKQELIACIISGNCYATKEGRRTHVHTLMILSYVDVCNARMVQYY